MPSVIAAKLRAEDTAWGLLVDVQDLEGGAGLSSKVDTLDVDTGNARIRLHGVRVQRSRGIRMTNPVTISLWTAFVQKIEVLS